MTIAVAIRAIATADAGMSLRKPSHFRIRSERLPSCLTFLAMLRAKNGESSGSAVWPRKSHNSWSSSRFILSP